MLVFTNREDFEKKYLNLKEIKIVILKIIEMCKVINYELRKIPISISNLHILK